MKILYVTTVGITMGFFPEHMKMLLAQGHEVELACNDAQSKIPQACEALGLKTHTVVFSRSPFHKTNLTAYRQLKQLIEEGNYDIVHTHTPNASVLVRLACRKLRKKGLKVFYTAHGFHFYKGAPLLNWMLYYPVEKLCARWTDTLITINREDYALAKKKMPAKRIEYVPGVGVDFSRFGRADAAGLRQELGIPEDAALLLSVGELNDNKNHAAVIKALSGLDAYYIIAGAGENEQQLQTMIDELGLSSRVRLLGFRNDVARLYAAADLFVFPSFREGLSVSLMEAMASGLPCAVSAIRGNVDLIDERGGVLFDPSDTDRLAAGLQQVLGRSFSQMGSYNAQKVKAFSQEIVLERMKEIYK